MHGWLVPHVVAPLYEHVTGGRPWTSLRRLRELQWRTPAEIEARAVRNLRGLLAHARAQVPYYRDLLRRAGVTPEDIRAVEDLAGLPVTTKADLRAALPEGALAADLPATRRLVGRTSGSTGEPFEFYLDRTDADIRRGSYLFFREWAGAPPWYTRSRPLPEHPASDRRNRLPGTKSRDQASVLATPERRWRWPATIAAESNWSRVAGGKRVARTETIDRGA